MYSEGSDCWRYGVQYRARADSAMSCGLLLRVSASWTSHDTPTPHSSVTSHITRSSVPLRSWLTQWDSSGLTACILCFYRLCFMKYDPFSAFRATIRHCALLFHVFKKLSQRNRPVIVTIFSDAGDRSVGTASSRTARHSCCFVHVKWTLLLLLCVLLPSGTDCLAVWRSSHVPDWRLILTVKLRRLKCASHLYLPCVMALWVSEWVVEWVSEWVSGWVSEWVNGRVSEWVSEWVIEWVRKWVIEWVRKWVIEWVSEWVSKWVSEWVNGWVSE